MFKNMKLFIQVLFSNYSYANTFEKNPKKKFENLFFKKSAGCAEWRVGSPQQFPPQQLPPRRRGLPPHAGGGQWGRGLQEAPGEDLQQCPSPSLL